MAACNASVNALYVDETVRTAPRLAQTRPVLAGNSYHTPKGVLGHAEWDEVVDNGWSPPNLSGSRLLPRWTTCSA